MQVLAKVGCNGAESTGKNLVRAARTPLMFDQTPEHKQAGRLAIVHLAQARWRQLGSFAFKLDAVSKDADHFLQDFVFASQVFLDILARVLDDEGECARRAGLAARNFVAILGFNMIGDMRTRRQHGARWLEGRRGPDFAHALRVLEQNSLFRPIVNAIHKRNIGQAEVIACVVGDLDRPWRRQFHTVGGAHDVDLRRLIVLDHDAVGAILTHRTPEKRQKPNPVRSIVVKGKSRRELAVVEIGHDRTTLAVLAQQ